MKYVLDSSTAFKCLVRETDTDQAIRLRDEYQAGIHIGENAMAYFVDISTVLTDTLVKFSTLNRHQ
ncbi:MAG: hypothetical protein EXS05_16225 [Planctomycetaceae bacterium]|nr:hypothetical protein [Planctomycetaceae bacterium]